MAKRKPLRDYRKPTSEQTKNTTRCNRSAKTVVLRAQEKHKFDNCLWPSHPTLADRFHALPRELRAQIFAHVLVQPVKWDIEHGDDCERRLRDADLKPDLCDLDCAGEYGPYFTCWRKRLYVGRKDLTSPWRSKWAPNTTTEFLCSDCYDKKFRPRPFPRATDLPCLCTRRKNLETLLVCKRWYHEAGRVFYTENTFAFEDASTFASFAKQLNPMWLPFVTKVSIMALSFEVRPDEVLDVHIKFSSEEFARQKQFGPSMWSLIRSLPSLSYLELDHIFLSNPKVVRSMQKLGLRNLRCMRFSQRLPRDVAWLNGTPTVWPAIAGRSVISGGFAEEIARTIKGQRQGRPKRSLEQAVLEYNEELEIKEKERYQKKDE